MMNFAQGVVLHVFTCAAHSVARPQPLQTDLPGNYTLRRNRSTV